jgi:hypothetical protein
MKNIILVLTCLFVFAACGMDVDVKDSHHDIGGEARIVVHVGFDLMPLKQLCYESLYPIYDEGPLLNKAVADCVFEAIPNLSTGIGDFLSNCVVFENQIICDSMDE